MRVLKTVTVVVALVVMTATNMALAKGDAVEVVVTGENICLACSLKAEQGAGAQCKTYGHKHSLRVASATVGGKETEKMNGWVLHYLETDNSAELIKQNHGKNLTISGTVYPNERVLEVVSVKDAKAHGDHPDHPAKSEHPDHPK